MRRLDLAASPARLVSVTRMLLVLSMLLAGIACSDGGEGGARGADAGSPASGSGGEPGSDDLVAAGRTVYMGNCIACHNPDPNLDGSLGPAIAGSSQELIEARVIHGTYPEGYTPKRSSGNMVPLPYLRNEIPALAAYLSQAARPAGS